MVSRKTQLQDIIVIGAGGQGRDVLSIINSCNETQRVWNFKGFLDDNSELYQNFIGGYQILGNLSYLKSLDTSINLNVAIGVIQTRRKLMTRIKEEFSVKFKFPNLIHRTSILTDQVVLGTGVTIHAGSIFASNSLIGNCVIIQIGSTIGHDTVIDDFVNVSPGVHISGHVSIGEGTFIGSGAVINEEIKIGTGSIVASGAVVIDDVPDFVLVAGVPAKVKKTLPHC